MAREIHRIARYYNSNGVGTAIVAVVTWDDGKVFDWAAYIGGSLRGAERKEWCVKDVAKSGCKMLRADAEYFFPNLPIERWRA